MKPGWASPGMKSVWTSPRVCSFARRLTVYATKGIRIMTHLNEKRYRVLKISSVATSVKVKKMNPFWRLYYLVGKYKIKNRDVVLALY